MRRRYVYSPEEGRCVEVTPDWQPTPTTGGHRSEAEVYGHLQATDGTPLDSRAKHRDYMRANGLALTSDMTDTWARHEAEHRARYDGTHPGERAKLHEAARRAYVKLQNRRR